MYHSYKIQCCNIHTRVCVYLLLFPNKNGIRLITCCLIAKSCPTLRNPQGLPHTGFPVLHYVPEFAQTHVHLIDNAIQPSHPLLPVSLCSQSFPASESFPVNWLFTSGGQSFVSFSFAISPPSEYSGLISFRIDFGYVKSLYFYSPPPMIHTLFVRNGV